MKTMANKRFWSVILVFVLVFNVVLSSCSTMNKLAESPLANFYSSTSAINYSSAEQPKGEYKYAVITKNTFDNKSVLQRFYSEYPSDKYEVVAIEKYNKNALPFTLTLGGALLGGMVGGVIGEMLVAGVPKDERLQPEPSLIFGGVGAVLFGTTGYFIGNHYRVNYVVTYVER